MPQPGGPMLNRLAVLLVVSLAFASCSSGSTPTVAPNAPQTWQINAGGSAQSEALQAVDFYPHAMTINEGDTIVWNFPALEPHTISIPPTGQPLPPGPLNRAPVGGHFFDGTAYISSGFINSGGSYAVTFTKAGTYSVFCLLHQPEMVAVITVQTAGSTLPATQAQYNSMGQDDFALDITAAAQSVLAFPYQPGGTVLAAGTQPGAPSGPPADSTVERFLDGKTMDANVTVPVGGTLTWNNISQLPHTVTFPVAGQLVAPGSPFRPAAGGASYDGSTYTNSGVMRPGGSYSLTFTAPGTYPYVCLFHGGSGENGEGMVGTVTVK